MEKEKSKGPSYTRFRCCSKGSCSKFESMWEAGECYANGGKLVRNCLECK